jgi:hypothetical protein
LRRQSRERSRERRRSRERSRDKDPRDQRRSPERDVRDKRRNSRDRSRDRRIRSRETDDGQSRENIDLRQRLLRKPQTKTLGLKCSESSPETAKKDKEAKKSMDNRDGSSDDSSVKQLESRMKTLWNKPRALAKEPFNAENYQATITRYVAQLFIKGDNVVMVSFA